MTIQGGVHVMANERGGPGCRDRDVEFFGPRVPWLHDLYDNPWYRWVVKNLLMRDDEHGIELTYRPRSTEDVICGARTMRPGIPDFTGYSWRTDQSVPHEVVCSVLGDHRETPHVGVPAECADMTCQCSRYGCYHLVIVGIAFTPPTIKALEDADV